MARLLIIACTQRKRPDKGLLAAIERYDGPPFRVLRRYLRENADHDVKVCVLSAEYGLIDGNDPISNYDRRMTSARANELRPSVTSALSKALLSERWRDAAICVGKQYIAALDVASLRSAVPRVTTLGGGLGIRLTRIRRWLTENRDAKR